MPRESRSSLYGEPYGRETPRAGRKAPRSPGGMPPGDRQPAARSVPDLSAAPRARTARGAGAALGTHGGTRAPSADERRAARAAQAEAEGARRARRARAVAIGCGALALLVAYAIGCASHTGRFWPNTTIGSVDVSGMTADEARLAMQRLSVERTVAVEGPGVSFTLTSSNAGLSLNVDAAVSEALSRVAPWQWPLQALLRHDETRVLSTSYDTEKLRSAVAAALEPYNATAADPVDASVYYDEASAGFKVDPGSQGTKYDVDRVVSTIVAAVGAEQDTASIGEAERVPQAATADDPLLASACAQANSFLECSLRLAVDGTDVAAVNGAVVKDWVYFPGDGTAAVDESLVAAWVDGLEEALDTVGATRTYTRKGDARTPEDKVVTVTGGTYGWVSDGAALERLVVDAVTAGYVGRQEVPFSQTAERYNPGGADWGDRYVDVDLTEQHARFYDERGEVVMECDIISGSTAYEGRATPEGVYYITNKLMNQTLVGLDDPQTGEPLYETPVTYWMPFIRNIVGLHDAWWQDEFGGTLYQTDAGSHGCINLPVAVAEWAYSYLELGDVVITHY